MADAVQTLINELQEYVVSHNAQPVKVTIATMVAAFQEIETAIAPVTTNVSAHNVYAGPTSGGPALPAFRLLVGGDIPISTVGAIGGVKPDGTTITITVGGVISAAAGGGPFLPLAGGTMTGTETFSDAGTWGSTGAVMPNTLTAAAANFSGAVGVNNALTITKATHHQLTINNDSSGSVSADISFLLNGAGVYIIGADPGGAIIASGPSNAIAIRNDNGPLSLAINNSGSENFRFASDGSFLVGTTTNGGWTGSSNGGVFHIRDIWSFCLQHKCGGQLCLNFSGRITLVNPVCRVLLFNWQLLAPSPPTAPQPPITSPATRPRNTI